MGRLIFVDQSRINMNPGPNDGLSPSGEQTVVIGKRPKNWEPRFDFMGACTGRRLLALETRTPAERKAAGKKGWWKEDVIGFFRDTVAWAVLEADLHGVVIVIDKGLKITSGEVMAAMEEGGVDDVEEAVILPSSTAKYISPLDNTLWHDLKERIRARPLTSPAQALAALRAEWEATPLEHLRNYYHHCSLTRRTDPARGRH